MMEKKSVRPKHAAEMLGIGAATLWRWVKEKKDEGFPQPMRLSARCTVFDQNSLLAWRDGQQNSPKNKAECKHGMPLSFGCDDCTIERLAAENKELAAFVVAVGGFWGETRSVLTGKDSLAEAINESLQRAWSTDSCALTAAYQHGFLDGKKAASQPAPRIDMKRLEAALKSESFDVPNGLSREEIIDFILIRAAHKPVEQKPAPE